MGPCVPLRMKKIGEDECEREKKCTFLKYSICGEKKMNNLMITISGFISFSQDQSKDIITKGS